MALKKGSKSKVAAKKPPVAKSEGIKGLEKVLDIPDNPNPSKAPEEKKPELIESEIDQAVRMAIRVLGESQSKFQQLRILRKSKKLRHIIKLARLISNDFK